MAAERLPRKANGENGSLRQTIPMTDAQFAEIRFIRRIKKCFLKEKIKNIHPPYRTRHLVQTYDRNISAASTFDEKPFIAERAAREMFWKSIFWKDR